MADATVALTSKPFPKGVDNTQRRQIVYGTAAITANAGTGPATGLPLNWAAIADGNYGTGTFQPQVGPTQTKPDFVTFQGQGSEATAEQLYTYDYTNNSLLVWRAGAFVQAAIAADTLVFKAEFIRGDF
jgi:hypothetical protein